MKIERIRKSLPILIAWNILNYTSQALELNGLSLDAPASENVS